MSACELCEAPGGHLVWENPEWRVVRVADAAFPAYYRVICKRHVKEFSDLQDAERVDCMALVTAVEQVLRLALAPAKINLASLGNQTPHLHWHVIARFDWDSHFPQSVWGVAQRPAPADPASRLALPLPQLDETMATFLAAGHAVHSH
jgi:diadenosine tetraphosphate (Ap4A) HIT family hydrolase